MADTINQNNPAPQKEGSGIGAVGIVAIVILVLVALFLAFRWLPPRQAEPSQNIEVSVPTPGLDGGGGGDTGDTDAGTQ